MSETVKRRLGVKAAARIQDGMCIGLGSGSTIYFFLEALGKRVEEGLSIRGCPTSIETARLAWAAKIPLISINQVDSLDLSVDGADLIDEQKRMIKGRGGALLREKIVAFHSKETLILIEEKKKVARFENCLLPIEVLPSADQLIKKRVKAIGFHSTIRLQSNGTPFVTDNQNHILDLSLTGEIVRPEDIEAELKAIPGIFETGFFFNLADTILVGREEEIEIWT